MTYIEAPAYEKFVTPSVFLAGGITGCSNWQQLARAYIEDHAPWATVLNPRRDDFDVTDDSATEVQIKWEFDHLRIADVVLFWFASETVQPITLYELGRHGALNARLAVGVHPHYPRRVDVYEQLRHARPLLPIRQNIVGTCQDAIKLLEEFR